MIILGVDPGTLRTGYGIISVAQGKTIWIASGTINLVKLKTLPEKLKKIYLELTDLIERYNPQEFAIETAFYGKNVQSAMKIGYARGVSILAAVNKAIFICEYSPREVKKSVVGTGAASKEQVNYMVKSILELAKGKVGMDESDALAVALCHSFRIKGISRKSTSWKSFVEKYPERIIQ